ncbi:hypothetical protein TSUD_93180 [Trifolium subterraneum]|uniref:Uncharacterized protein n=1 Tax=Trifolium subterraneum TaxID=3900 RepID=A0A2Z6LTE4_TRISU|nr:hypothetical protein TSUD_93180 [Trifolium subterraneum]
MTNPITDTPNETLNPNTSQQCPEEEQQPPPPPTDPQSSEAPQNPQIQNDPDSTNPNQDQDTLMEDPIHPQIADDPEPEPPSPATTTVRRGGKRKKPKNPTAAQKKKFQEKFQGLIETLKPIPFKPAKALDFESHQSLLERLGLWDFVHIEFDSVVRTDLVAQLIASYNPANRCSYVNDVKVMVNRAELGRALKLPKKYSVAVDEVGEVGVRDIAFLKELVSNWMLLHDDTFIITKDIMQLFNLINEGNFEKVDWAGLMWGMLDKELKSLKLVECYYASHLQHLIKSQHKELLEETPAKEVVAEGEEGVTKDEEEEGETKDEEEEEEGVVIRDEVDGSGDVRMGGVEENQVRELEEHNVELSLGQDNVETLPVEKEQAEGEQMMDFDQSKEVEPEIWLFGQKNCVGEPSLRPCQKSEMKGLDYGQVKEDEGEYEEDHEQEEDEDAEEDEHEVGFHLSPKYHMDGMPSANGSPIQSMEAVQMPFGSGIDLRDNSVGDFLSARDDPQMIAGSSLFGNGHKRDIGLDNHNSHHTLNGGNKRQRSDSPWSSKPLDFEGCMEQMEHWMGKARMIYASKDQAVEESAMNQQILLEELQKRDEVVNHLHKAKIEEAQKRQMEVYRLEKELYMMQSLVEGYRKALKETQKAFADYRARCPQADEPLYKDVPDSGGLVLSVMDLEKERLKKEEEERVKLREFFRDFEKNCKDIEEEWMGQIGILKKHLSRVESLGDKLQALDDKVKQLKEVNAKSKISDPLEIAPLSEAEAA